MSTEDYTDRIADAAKQLKRRTIQISELIETSDKEVVNELMKATEDNSDRLDNSKNKIDVIAKTGKSFGWFDLIYVGIIIYVVNYLMNLYIKLFKV